MFLGRSPLVHLKPTVPQKCLYHVGKSLLVETFPDVVQSHCSNFITYQNCRIATPTTSRSFPKVQKTIMVGGKVDDSWQHYVVMGLPCISLRRSTEKVSCRGCLGDYELFGALRYIRDGRTKYVLTGSSRTSQKVGCRSNS